MRNQKNTPSSDILAYQPDAVEIEERPVPGKARWVLYLILFALVAVVVGATIFKVDRIVVAQGHLITTTPTIVVQPLNTAMIRAINVQVGDLVDKGQVLATLDATFTSADLSVLSKRRSSLGVQIRRIQAELEGKPFAAQIDEGEEGRLQEQLLAQRKLILERNKQLADDKIAALNSKLSLNRVQQEGLKRQLKLLRDVEGITARLPQNDTEYRLRLLVAQKDRFLATNDIESLEAERQVTLSELSQAKSDWRRFVEERNGQLMEQTVQLRNEHEKVIEEIQKAQRLQELVSLRAPQQGIVLSIAERSVGSIMQAAEPLVTLVPVGSDIEAEVDVQSKDIARIRTGDSVRVKLDAFPFQRHDTLPGTVRVISENSYQQPTKELSSSSTSEQNLTNAFYRTRVKLLSTKLRNVPQGFRLMPGMKVRTEIKVGTRSVASYFLYPIIRALDESLREP